MKTPIISLICPINRPDLFVDCFKRWEDSSIPFEIIFLGPHGPKIEFPENVRYIQTKVKPVQAWAYGFFIANGDLVSLISDDLIPIKPENEKRPVLDVLYSEWSELHDKIGDNLILSFSPYIKEMREGNKYIKVQEEYYEERRKKILWEVHRGFEDSDILLPLGGIFKKDFYLKIGGPDNRFLSGQADVEMYIRMILNGGKVEFSKIEWHEIKKHNWGNTNFSAIHPLSRKILTQIRSENFESPKLFDFRREDILLKNQGAFYKFWPDDGFYDPDLDPEIMKYRDRTPGMKDDGRITV